MVKKSGLFVISIIIVLLLIGIGLIYGLPLNTQAENSKISPNDTLEVIFFDVGQGDCILLKTGNHSMLIDAGNIGQDQLVLNYLAKNNVTNLDYLVVTHPHSDHIGSMSSVINKMDNVGMVIMPDKIHTSKTFENLIDAIEYNNIPVTMPKPGDNFTLGNADIQVLAPISATSNDLNDHSIVLRVDFGNTSFLFTGDAETKSENKQLITGLNLEADVLKVGHHGSKTSTSEYFINKIKPKYSIISVGENNLYNHPNNETLLNLNKSKILRTDKDGTIKFTINNKLKYKKTIYRREKT